MSTGYLKQFRSPVQSPDTEENPSFKTEAMVPLQKPDPPELSEGGISLGSDTFQFDPTDGDDPVAHCVELFDITGETVTVLCAESQT